MSTYSDLRIDVREEPGRVTVADVSGPLDLHTAPFLHQQLTRTLERNPALILNLAGVSFCDSSGLNTLIRLHRRAQDAGGRLMLAAPPAHLSRMLVRTGLDTVLHRYVSVGEAQAQRPAR
ncbi:STAS domain-containing protein [Streptomyces sp. NPDC017435]|uniref:STAS domain-containing protein n=1 Tax=Streptomyces sp. NPDC017435 TaxID=3364995 RepID=UPI00379A4806